jgi:flagellar basal-body rod protein FlgB
MTLVDTTQQALEAAMSGSELRQTLLTNNLANVSTPGYQPQDVDFQSTLQQALSSGQALDQVSFQPHTNPAMAGPDGNGVSANQQQAYMAENGLLYETLTQIAAQREHIMLTAMGMGGGG